MSNYLDYNASTPIDPRVLNVMIDAFQNKYGNADSRTHEFGESARRIVEESRGSIAKLLDVNKDEEPKVIIFQFLVYKNLPRGHRRNT